MMNPYALLDVFTLDEAVQAITGVVQSKTAEEKNQVRLVERALQGDIDSEKLKADVTQAQRVLKERIGMRRVTIGDTRDYRPIVEHPYTETIIRIARADLLAWCESRGIRPPMLFPDPPIAANAPDNDDLSGHRTPALDALRAAIRQFWLHHDPKRPPKGPDIVGWLKDECGMTKTMAESIDRVIRPAIYAKGGNIKRS